MALKARTIRVSDPVWENVKREAEREGVSASQWIQESLVSRLVWSMAQRDDEILRDYERIFEALRKVQDDKRPPA